MAASSPLLLVEKDWESLGDGLAGSIREGGVPEDEVNLESRVSREYSLPAYCNILIACC